MKVRDVQPIMEHLLDRAEKAEKELQTLRADNERLKAENRRLRTLLEDDDLR